MDRTTKLVIRKVACDLVIVFAVGMAVLMFYLFGQPFKRGFFCGDESISYPWKKKSTVTSFMLYVTGLALPIGVMGLGEYMSWNSLGSSNLVIRGRTIPQWVVMAYSKIGFFGFGAAATVMTTDVAKYTIGRLRPHFMELCIPSENCSFSYNQNKYIQDYECLNKLATLKDQKEARLSFPSGHSSFSAYTMVYLALYLQLRCNWNDSKLLRHLLQFICILMAWYTAMSRISDYKHHWSDVLTGLCIGTTIALVVAFKIAYLFSEGRAPRFEVQCVESSPEATQAANNGTGANNHVC